MRAARKPVASLVAGVAQSLAMLPARALDVDRIEPLSRLGEPLLAEIPVTGASAADLAQLQAQLASPTTFARVGLPRPAGVVAGLRFDVVREPRPVIRVSSAEPVDQAFLTFLLQVDAPQGRLVREYSLSLAAPSVTTEPVSQAAIELAPAAPRDSVARNADVAGALPVPSAHGFAPAAPPESTPDVPPIPVVGDPPRVARQAGAPPRQAATAGRVRGLREIRVREGDTLGGAIAAMRIEGATPAQAMLAVLRTNADAFAAGNIHRLRQGAVLRAPAGTELTRFDPASADAVVRLQTGHWQAADAKPVVMPARLAPLVEAVAPVAPLGSPSGAARLELGDIGPDDRDAGAVGTSGDVGDPMDARRAAADRLAADYTRFRQMQQRIAELEQARQSQERLLALRNRQLAGRAPQWAQAWPWLAGALVLGALLGGALQVRGVVRPRRVSAALAARLQGAAQPPSAASR